MLDLRILNGYVVAFKQSKYIYSLIFTIYVAYPAYTLCLYFALSPKVFCIDLNTAEIASNV